MVSLAAFAASLAAPLRLPPFADFRPPRSPKTVALAAAVPIALTLAFEWTTGVDPSNGVRAISGIPAGAAVAWLVLTDW